MPLLNIDDMTTHIFTLNTISLCHVCGSNQSIEGSGDTQIPYTESLYVYLQNFTRYQNIQRNKHEKNPGLSYY